MNQPRLRTFAYIDGFNLYNRCVKGTPHKWLDIRALLEKMLEPENELEQINYYTARVSGRDDPMTPVRQHAYLRALATIRGISIYYGSFLKKQIIRPIVDPIPPTFAQVHTTGFGSKVIRPTTLPSPAALKRTYVTVDTTEEKGSDVNLASHLVRDGCKGAFDVAVVVSNDTDLIEPIRIVVEELGKIVGLLSPVGRPSPKLIEVSTFLRNITDARLAGAHLPNPVTTPNGKQIFKPSSW